MTPGVGSPIDSEPGCYERTLDTKRSGQHKRDLVKLKALLPTKPVAKRG